MYSAGLVSISRVWVDLIVNYVLIWYVVVFLPH